MAAITKANVSLDMSSAQHAFQITAPAGETIVLGEALYLKSDGKLWLADGGAQDAEARFLGLAAIAATAGYPVTAFGPFSRWRYSTGMTIGNLVYLSATDGALDTAVTVGGWHSVGLIVSATDVVITHMYAGVNPDTT